MNGTDPCLNVFDVSASDFTGTTQRNLFVPAGAFALVNIHGTGTTLSGGFNSGLDAQRVLYNFVDATSFDARNFGLTGTVLAPNARVTLNQGGWTGGLYALSLSGNAIGHLSALQDCGAVPSRRCATGWMTTVTARWTRASNVAGSSTRSCTAWCGAAGTQTLRRGHVRLWGVHLRELLPCGCRLLEQLLLRGHPLRGEEGQRAVLRQRQPVRQRGVRGRGVLQHRVRRGLRRLQPGRTRGHVQPGGLHGAVPGLGGRV